MLLLWLLLKATNEKPHTGQTGSIEKSNKSAEPFVKEAVGP